MVALSPRLARPLALWWPLLLGTVTIGGYLGLLKFVVEFLAPHSQTAVDLAYLSWLFIGTPLVFLGLPGMLLLQIGVLIYAWRRWRAAPA